MKSKLCNSLGVTVFLLTLLFFPTSARALTVISGSTLSENTIWTVENSPYVINGALTIPAGIVLSIEPGVVIKFAHIQSTINVQGALQVNGTDDNKVYFTSYKDDLVGGDTNGDENATIPGARDWPQIIIHPGASANFNYVVVRYGGYRAFSCPNNTCFGAINNRGTLNFSHSRIFQTDKYGIYQTAGSATVDSSLVHDQAQTGVYVTGGELSVSNSTISDQGHTGIVVTSGSSNFHLNNNVFQSNVRDVSVYAAVNFTHANNVSEGGLGRGFYIEGATVVNSVWNADSMPYIVAGFITVPASSTLSIEPGTVIKFAHNQSQIVVSGALNVAGTQIDKVYFTSLKDDELIGDTNGNGNATMPAANDWLRILINLGATAEIDNAIIKYGGYRQFSCPYFTCYGAINSKGNLNLTNSEVSNNGTYGIYQTDSGSLTAHNSSIFNHSGFGIVNYSANTVDATNNWWGDDTGPYHPTLNPTGRGNGVSDNVLFDPWIGKITKNSPVIIIPGILGSAEKDGVWLIDPIFHTYDNLVDTLAANGYAEGTDLFTFPYNWRQSNVLTAFQLHQKIDEVKSVCACDKVDLVAHSMGGLVARQYAQSGYYENDIDQLIFLGTPHLGAPEDYLSWGGGELNLSFVGQAIKFLLSREAKKLGYNNLFDYIRNNPISSVQELLPIYDYLRDKDTGLLREYPNNYPINTFLESLNNTSSTLFSSGINITNIMGDAGAFSTLSALRVVPSTDLPLWEHGYPEGFNEKIGDQGLEMGKGDNTVPEISSNLINIESQQINSNHRSLPDSTKDVVFKKLTDNNATLLVDRFHLPDTILIIKLLSPVDMVVIAPDGKRIGKDFGTGQEINEIDNAFYSGFNTDNEYITIPNPLEGEYQVETIGTDNGGEYTVAAGLITDQGSSEYDFTATTLPGMLTTVNIEVSNASSTIEVTPADTLPPMIIIHSPEARDYTRAEALLINTTSTDDGVGVWLLQVSFDDKIVNNNEVADLFFEHLGEHTLSATATDFVGNVSTSSVSFRIIATVSSTLSDVERAYSLGWITKEQVKDKLERDLNRIGKIEKRIEFLEEKLADKPKVIKQIERMEKVIDRVLAKQLAEKLERYQTQGWLNDAAHSLLTEDINWLLNN